jgi:glycosyltransferase involved in cell wall biosynthesis
MHVLITSDTVGGVWTYTQELVTGLARAGHRITLVSFGKIPLPHQTAWMQTVPALDYRPTEYRLEWMEVVERDIEESRGYLELLVDEVQPDVLHFSQYCYGDLPVDVPRVVVAHSDVVSWWVAVHGSEPEDTPWIQRYRRHVMSGLAGADVVVAPSQWMLDAVAKHYLQRQHGTVIYNGRTPALFDPSQQKEDYVLSVGRVWDPAKQISVLLETPGDNPVRIVGWEREPGKDRKEALLRSRDYVELLGPKSQSELQSLYSRASIYAATSQYEPFGLAPLEAAFSGCALVMNDNPVFHELWGDAAIYFDKNDAVDLGRRLDQLRTNPGLREEYAVRAYDIAAAKFTASRMVGEYENVYQSICSVARLV